MVKVNAHNLVENKWPVESNLATLVQVVRDHFDNGQEVVIDFTGYNRWSRSTLFMLYQMLAEVLPPDTIIKAEHATVNNIVSIWEDFYL
jgi:hypothetical protein